MKIAKSDTAFYSDYIAFEEFPVISKAVLREKYPEFLSSKIDKEESIITTTSGSTGQPMTFYLSKNKKYRQNAEIIFFNRWANIDVGDYHAYVRVTNLKSKVKLFIQNEVLMNPKNLSNEWLDAQIKVLRNGKPIGIIGYPSAIGAIAKRASEKKLTSKDFRVKGIATSGENLEKQDAAVMERVFGVKPISRYSTEEFGVLATSCPKCGKYHVNDTGYVIEVLGLDDSKPVEVGESGKIVVTDLFSDNIPLIRFDTGDLAVFGGKSQCSFYPTGITFDSIVGRQVETIFDVNGKPVSAFAINGSLRDFHTIKRFQFIQESLDDNTLLLMVNDEFKNTDKETVIERFAKVLGKAPIVKIVDDLPALKSGKRPYIISNYFKKIQAQKSAE